MKKLTFTNNQIKELEEIKTRMGDKNTYIDEYQEANNYIIVSSWNNSTEFETKIYNDGETLTSHRGLEKGSIWTEYEEDILPL